jgi:hypothetical protein
MTWKIVFAGWLTLAVLCAVSSGPYAELGDVWPAMKFATVAVLILAALGFLWKWAAA